MTVTGTHEIQSAGEAAAVEAVAAGIEAALRTQMAENKLPASIVHHGALRAAIMLALDDLTFPEVASWLRTYADAFETATPLTADKSAASAVILPFPSRSK